MSECELLNSKGNRRGKKITHGFSRNGKTTPTYQSWVAMKSRCLNPKNDRYKNYGGRGIKICERWLNSFENFYQDMGEKPAEMSMERINVNGNYEPSNCKWATRYEQYRNKTDNTYFESHGERLITVDWARKLGLSLATFQRRVKRYGIDKVYEMYTQPPETEG